MIIVRCIDKRGSVNKQTKCFIVVWGIKFNADHDCCASCDHGMIQGAYIKYLGTLYKIPCNFTHVCV